ncbi:MAG: MFS transporter [Bacillus sp. (in: firmicutes)]
MNTKKVLPLLFLVMFMVMVGFGIIIPVMPFLAREIGANPAELGLLMAVYSLMQLIFAPIWGRVSDRIGRKPVMLIGIAGLSLSFFMIAVADSLTMLMLARVIGGTLSAANMPTAMAYVADITSEEDRGKGMGIIGAATGLGFVFGPAIGGVFSQSSLELPFYLSGFTSLFTLLLVAVVLKESLPAEERGKSEKKRPSMLSAIKGVNGLLFIMQFIITFSLAGLEATFAYFSAAKAGLTTAQLGYAFMIMGLAGAIVQGGLIGPLTKRFGEAAVIRTGILMSGLGFILILFSQNFWTSALFLAVFGVGNGIIRPSVVSLLTKGSTSGHGSITGLLSSFDSLGRILGPPIGGWLFSMSAGLPFVSGACLSVIAFILFRSFDGKLTKHKSLSV